MPQPLLQSKSTSIRKRVVAAAAAANAKESKHDKRDLRAQEKSARTNANTKTNSNESSIMTMVARSIRSVDTPSTAAMPNSSGSNNTGESAKQQQHRRPKATQSRSRTLLMWTMVLTLLPLSYWFVTRRVGSDEVLDATSTAAATSKSKRNKNKNRNPKLKINEQQQLATIIEEYRTLVQLSVPNGALLSQQQQQQQQRHRRYGKVRATFCEIDWDLQAANPSTVAMFRDLQAQSSRCKETQTVVVDLHDLVQAAKEYDGYHDDPHSNGNSNNNNNSNENSNNININNDNEVYPTGVVFHETRCGSTLVANLLAGSATEGRSRVYSESPPPIAALTACNNNGGKSCDPDLHKALIRDVFYMMGRRKRKQTSENERNNNNNNEEQNRVFYKIQSIGVMSIDKYVRWFCPSLGSLVFCLQNECTCLLVPFFCCITIILMFTVLCCIVRFILYCIAAPLFICLFFLFPLQIHHGLSASPLDFCLPRHRRDSTIPPERGIQIHSKGLHPQLQSQSPPAAGHDPPGHSRCGKITTGPRPHPILRGAPGGIVPGGT